ncbi:MAG: AtpZ/AtpI family protein [Magnetospiraceae bacterium]
MTMNGGDPPNPMENFDDRLRRAREQARPKESRWRRDLTSMSGFGAAFRIGTELVAALVIGVGVGYALDGWLDTRPWLMIFFFFLGSAAGILNVYRAASGIGSSFTYRIPEEGTGEGGTEGKQPQRSAAENKGKRR